ncbi:PucR family transcriptional regulator, partial [Nonomuraea lactucae]|uniref:PucR family transcriptional regulator n=1 Tax=Nonomuraea lactucae TaxID=2249762 RepID=UPI0013B3CAB0
EGGRTPAAGTGGGRTPVAGVGGGRPSAAGAGGGAGAERVPSSLAISEPGQHIVVQPLGGGARPRGFFAVGAARAFSPVTHTVINAAGSLLTLALEQGGARLEAERRVRSSVLELLLAGAHEQAVAALAPLGGRLPEEPLVVLAAAGEALDVLEPRAFAARIPSEPPAPPPRFPSDPDEGAAGVPPTRGAAGALPAGGALGASRRAAGGSSSGGPAFSGAYAPAEPEGEELVVAVVGESAAEELAGLAGAAGAAVGMSGSCSYLELGGGLDQARRALAAGGGGVVRFADLAGQGLLRLLDPAAARAFAAALLAPLTRYGSRADLVESLRAYLDSNGHWDAAAQRLGVHRHTLRYRMKRVAELLGRDLDDPGVRAELWIALAATPSPATSSPDSSRSSPS